MDLEQVSLLALLESRPHSLIGACPVNEDASWELSLRNLVEETRVSMGRGMSVSLAELFAGQDAVAEAAGKEKSAPQSVPSPPTPIHRDGGNPG